MKGLIFTYVLTYGGALLAVFNPYVGLLIYVCFAIIKPEAMWHWNVPIGNYSRIVAIGLLLGWLLNGMGNFAGAPAAFSNFYGTFFFPSQAEFVLPIHDNNDPLGIFGIFGI